MKITISPIAGLPGQPETELTIVGDVITIDSTAYDLSSVPEGGEATPAGDPPFVGSITRISGEIVCTVNCFYDAATADPVQPADPAHWTVTVASGPVVLPVIRIEEPQA